ncbi:MAG TPA: ATP-binding protein, partial [Planctomycetota bacterium]|nr:ATP-binding protein [Planctomycetota bacterium]
MRRKTEARSRVLTGKVRPADPFELIQWLAHCQQDARKAVAELVQNSLDAGAKRVDLVRKRDKGALCLAIVDDGQGVIPELPRAAALEHVATHIGHSRKRNLTPQQRRELMIQGQFGIGILGFWCLGAHFVMRSAVPGEEPWELHLHAEQPGYEVRPSRGNLPFASGTVVTVRELREGVVHLLGARRLGDYLALELRGQILERAADVTIHDRVARGLAQKVFAVKPVQFAGRRLAPEQLHVPGHRPAQVELYLVPAGDAAGRVTFAAGGTLVLDDLVQLDPERLDGTAFASGRFCGVVDFADVEVSPGARRGVKGSEATVALVDALRTLLPLLDGELLAEQRRSDEEVEQRQIRKLRRAFLAVRRKAPEFELFAVPGAHPAADAVAERMACSAPGELAPASRAPNGGPPESDAAAEQVDDGPEALHLFPPGPLHHLAVTPERTRVELLGTRRLLAIPRDADQRRVRLQQPVAWRVLSGPGRIQPEGIEGVAGRFQADTMEGVSVIEASACDGQRSVAGQAVIKTVLGQESSHPGLGIPSPAFVEDPSGDWRSRMRDGTWEVNRAHPDFREASTAERRQLRYLSSLLAKEIVSRTWPSPQNSRVLEQLVRLLAIVEQSLE